MPTQVEVFREQRKHSDPRSRQARFKARAEVDYVKDSSNSNDVNLFDNSAWVAL